MQSANSSDEETIPLAEETISVGKETRATANVRIHTHTNTVTETLTTDLSVDHVEVERIPVNQFVGHHPQQGRNAS